MLGEGVDVSDGEKTQPRLFKPAQSDFVGVGKGGAMIGMSLLVIFGVGIIIRIITKNFQKEIQYKKLLMINVMITG